MSYIDYLKDHGKEDFKIAAKECVKSHIQIIPVTAVILFLVTTFIGYRQSK